MLYSGKYLVVGPPGTGKTTWLARQVQACVDAGQAPLVSSLTRAAIREAFSRELPIPWDHVGTLHAHGHRAMGAPEVTDAYIQDFNEREPFYAMTPGRRGGRGESRGYDDMPGKTHGDQLSDDYHLARHCMTPRDRWRPEMREYGRRWEAWKKEEGLVDYTDMIELPLHDQPTAPGNPRVLLVDEAQDLSALEHKLLERWAVAADALIAIGDPWQAIYVWRGADPSEFADPAVSDDHRRTLRQSYRIPAAIQRVSMAWARPLGGIEHQQYAPRSEEGEVVAVGGVNWLHPAPLVAEIERDLAAGWRVMVLASCAYMLRCLIAKLRDRGLPFANPWCVENSEWNPLRSARRGATRTIDRILAFLCPFGQEGERDGFDFGHNVGSSPLGWPAGELVKWLDLIRSSGVFPRGMKRRYADLALLDPTRWITLDEVLGGCSDGVPETLQGAVCWLADHVLASKAPSVHYPLKIFAHGGFEVLAKPPQLYVGTIHSFKGAEADVVYLFPDVSPAAYTTMMDPLGSAGQVVRQFYVGMTRARHKLVLVQAAGERAVNFKHFV
jgi:hypothetical protein